MGKAVAMSDGEYAELYRHYNVRGVLLYVGQSANALGRLAEHQNYSRWFDQVSYVTIVRVAKHLINQAERQAIKAEKPIYNQRHNKKPPKRPKGYESYLTPEPTVTVDPLSIKHPLRLARTKQSPTKSRKAKGQLSLWAGEDQWFRLVVEAWAKNKHQRAATVLS
jgi:predicted GIY-YIG superfamily endonuclease